MAVVGSGAGMSAFDANRLRCVGWQLSTGVQHAASSDCGAGSSGTVHGWLPTCLSTLLLCGCSTLRAEAESWKDRSESLMGQVRELQRQQQVSVSRWLPQGCGCAHSPLTCMIRAAWC